MAGLLIALALWVLVVPALALVVAVRARDRALRVETRLAQLERGGAPRSLEAPAAQEAVPPEAPPAAPPLPAGPAAAPSPGRTVEAGRAARPASPTAAASLEERIGVTWFTRIGAAVLILGALYFFKYAIDSQWIGPWGRVALGVLAGAAVIALAERQAGRASARYVQALLGVGLALLYVAAYATYGFYRLLPMGAAFAALVVVSVLGGALALRHRAEAVLVIALGGALATPLLLVTGEDQAAALFAYLALLAAAATLVSLRERQRAAVWLAFTGVAALWLVWCEAHFDVGAPDLDPVTGAAIAASGGAYLPLPARALPLLFVVALAALWVWAARRAEAIGWGALPPVALLVAAVLVGQWQCGILLAGRPALNAAAMVAWALVVTVALDRAAVPGVSLMAAVAALAVLVAAAPEATAAPGAFLAAAALWGGCNLAAAWRRLLVRPTGGATVLLALAGPLGLVALTLIAVPAGDAGLRAAITAAAGAALFTLGAALLQRHPESRGVAAAVLGGALGVIALAVGLAFSGVTITLLWAVLAAVVAYLAARRGDTLWLGGAALLFLLVLGRLLAVDASAPLRDHLLFASSHGAAGRLTPVPLVNPRALALLGVAVALGAAAWSARRRREEPTWRPAGAIAATLSHVLLASFVISEARLLVVSLPPAPRGVLPAEEFTVFLDGFRAALSAQASRLAVSSTLVLGGFGAVLLGIGFTARSVLHRWLGLVALALTLGKLALWDVWTLPRLYQVLVLVAVGALLLGAGFLYARFGRRLLGFLRGATPAALLLLAASVEALDTTRHTTRAFVDAPGAGFVAVTVTPELFRASAVPGGLTDLRIAGPDGAEVPWLLRDEPAREPVRELPAELLDPVALADGSARATFDLGAGERRHDTVRLDLAGEEFLREVQVETGDDRLRWGRIAEGVVFRVRSGDAGDERTVLRYPPSAARFVRVTVAGGAGQPPVAIRGGGVALCPEAAEPPTGVVGLVVAGRSDDAERKHSVLVLDAGGAGVPLRAILVSVSAPRFERRADVEASEDGTYWHRVGSGVLYRAGAGESLRIAAVTSRRHLRLVIDNGDDAPLPVERVEGEYRRQQLVLAASGAGRHLLLVGCHDLPVPRYDLASVLAREPDAVPVPAALSALEANPELKPVPRAVAPWTERHRVEIGLALGVVLLGLACWAVRAMRRERKG